MHMETVQHGQVAFTRHPEGVGDPLGDQAFDEQVAGNLGHGLT